MEKNAYNGILTPKDKSYIDIIERIKSLKSLKNYVSFNEILDTCESDIRNKEYRVTVVGQFSSGKSTMLNALIGKDVLTHANTETTATITYIHNVPENDSRVNKIEVHFKEGKETEILPLTSDALKNYTSTFSKENNVVKEIYSVDLYVHFTETDYPIVLIDTPGLNGMAMGHREITLREIEKSHASICLFDVKGVGSADMETLDLVTKHQNVFFFVLNSVDKLNESEGMSYEERMIEFKKEIKDSLYNGQKDAEYVYGISALNALEARDPQAYEKFNKGNKLTPEKKASCLKYSHIDTFESALYSYLKGSDKEKEFYESIKIKLLTILNRIKEDAEGEKKTRSVEAENIPERNILLKRKEKISIQIDGYRKEIENSLYAKISDIEKEIKNINSSYWEKKSEQLMHEITSIDNLDVMKQCVEKNTFGYKLVEAREISIKDLENSIMSNMQDVYDKQLTEIKSRLPEIRFDEKGKVDIVVDYKKFDEFNYNKDLTREQELQRKKRETENKMKSLSSEESVSSVINKLNTVENAKNSYESKKRSEIDSLGSRPIATKEAVYDYVDDSSCLRKLGDFFGVCERSYKKVVDHYEYDDSAGKVWDADRARINREYDSKIRDKEKEIEYLYRQLEKSRSNEVLAKRYKQDIANIEIEIQDERRFQAELESKAKSSFLRKLKDDITKMISEGVDEIRKDNNVGIEDNIKEGKKILSEELKRFYDEKTVYYLKTIDILIAQIENRGDNLDNSQAIKTLTEDLNAIDSIEKQLETI